MGGDRKGPVDENAMQALVQADVVESETLVWSDGMADWEPAYRHIKGLVPPAPGGAPSLTKGRPRAGGRNYAEPIGIVGAFNKAFRNFANFRDRASRGEFWWFVLANILIGIVLGYVDTAVFGPSLVVSETGFAYQTGVFGSLWSLIVLIPNLALGARRLHDIDKSGWWQLIALTVVGIIVLIVWYAQEGDKEANTYG